MLPVVLRDSMCSTLISLFKLAYKSRVSLPLLVSAGFMLLDLHMRLELEIEAHVQQENNNGEQQEAEE
jgi:hypothetical protein